MKPAVLAFSGRIASGKTTVSLEISRQLGWKRASFGDFVRKEAYRRGFDNTSRKTLQEIGNELIERGWTAFCLSVLGEAQWEAGEGLVIDGIRHLEGLEAIREIVSPLKLFLLFISVNSEIREHRLSKKSIGKGQIAAIEEHSTESQVRGHLKDHADLIIDGATPISSIVQSIMDLLTKQLLI
jgi:dephospho-CoA kinase